MYFGVSRDGWRIRRHSMMNASDVSEIAAYGPVARSCAGSWRSILCHRVFAFRQLDSSSSSVAGFVPSSDDEDDDEDDDDEEDEEFDDEERRDPFCFFLCFLDCCCSNASSFLVSSAILSVSLLCSDDKGRGRMRGAGTAWGAGGLA